MRIAMALLLVACDGSKREEREEHPYDSEGEIVGPEMRIDSRGVAVAFDQPSAFCADLGPLEGACWVDPDECRRNSPAGCTTVANYACVQFTTKTGRQLTSCFVDLHECEKARRDNDHTTSPCVQFKTRRLEPPIDAGPTPAAAPPPPDKRCAEGETWSGFDGRCIAADGKPRKKPPAAAQQQRHGELDQYIDHSAKPDAAVGGSDDESDDPRVGYGKGSSGSGWE